MMIGDNSQRRQRFETNKPGQNDLIKVLSDFFLQSKNTDGPGPTRGRVRPQDTLQNFSQKELEAFQRGSEKEMERMGKESARFQVTGVSPERFAQVSPQGGIEQQLIQAFENNRPVVATPVGTGKQITTSAGPGVRTGIKQPEPMTTEVPNEQNKLINFLGRLLTASPQRVAADLQLRNQKELAKYEASLPLSNARREEIGLEQFFKTEQDFIKRKTDFFSEIANPKPLAGDSATKYGFAEQANNAALELLNIFSQDPGSIRRSLTSPKGGQQVRNLIKKLKAELTPARAGASLTESERKLVETLIPEGGWKALIENPEEVVTKLQGIIQGTTRTMNLINPNERTRTLVTGLRGKGFSDDEIFSYIMRGGWNV